MKIKCPTCSKVLSIPETAAGKIVKCPCGKQLRAPAAAGKPAAPKRPTPAMPSPARPAATQSAAPQQPAANPAFSPAPATSDFGSVFDDLTDQDLQPVKSVQQPGRTSAPAASSSKALQGFADGAGKSSGGSRSFETADPGRRILASIIDGVFFMAFIAVGIGVMIAVQGAPAEGEEPSMVPIVILTCFYVVPAIVNATLIGMSGQTLGKKAMKIRIVDADTGQTAGFAQGFLSRTVAFGFVTGIPFVGALIGLADCFYLFIEDHRTLHDRFAKTAVEVVR